MKKRQLFIMLSLLALAACGGSDDGSDQPVVELAEEEPRVLTIPADGFVSPTSYDGWQLVWQDEFEGRELNPDNWQFEIGNGENGWGNNELQYYRSENTSIVEGNLVIEAKKETFSGSNYTSSRLVTLNKQQFKYGRIDIRATLPYGKGIWPALWMLGANFETVGWPACGEIDIMEMIGGGENDDTVYGTVHWQAGGIHAEYGGNKALPNGALKSKFHVFSIIWDESKIVWLVDDQEFHVIDTTPSGLDEFREDFFFIINMAVGGNWPGSPDLTTVFPQWLIVDYVRVFQPL